MRNKVAGLIAAVPVVALIAGLPFANRVEPAVVGLPFLLAWFVGWVLATPLFLGAAYWLTRPGDATHREGTAPRARSGR